MGPAFGLGSDLVRPRERSRPRFQLRTRPQYQLLSPRQSPRSLRDFDYIRLGWDPGPRHLYLSAELGGPGPPSGPAHRAQASHLHPGPNHCQSHQLQRRHLHLNCHLPPGLGGLCTSGTPFRGTSHYTRGTSIRSLNMTSRH